MKPFFTFFISCVDLSIQQPTYLSLIFILLYVCLSPQPTFYMSGKLTCVIQSFILLIFMSIYPTICPFICICKVANISHSPLRLSIYLSVYLSICLSIYPSIYLSIYLSIYFSLFSPTVSLSLAVSFCSQHLLFAPSTFFSLSFLFSFLFHHRNSTYIPSFVLSSYNLPRT